MGINGPTVTGSAALHAERIRARDEERAAVSKDRDTRQTYEIYGEQAAAGFRADEAARERARLNELRARGLWVPGDGEETDDGQDVAAEEFEEEPAEDSDGEEQLSTAERYARRERARQAAERRANARAQAGAVRTMGPTV